MLSNAVNIFKQGGIIAYPTEAVFGLGCDPMNEDAVLRLLALKKRNIDKGLILIASTVEQLYPYISEKQIELNPKILTTWPGPNTWTIPCKDTTPKWLTGIHDTLAVRVTAHPTVIDLCNAVNSAIVSTSANISGQPAAKDADEVNTYFKQSIDCVIDGKTGGQSNVTSIYDAISNKKIR